MSLLVLDTDHLTLYQMGHAKVVRAVARHVADELAVTVISIEEQLMGWHTALHQATDDARREQIYLRMARTVESVATWKVLPFSLAAMGRHAALMRQRLNIGSNDLKIAAITLEMAGTVVTRNRRDFGRVPGLLWEDWTT